MHSSHDNREYSRINVNFPLSIELSNQRQAKGIAINIGQGGMLLECTSGTAFAKMDDVNLYLPYTHNHGNFTIAAKVTRVNESQIGLFFYSDPSEYLQEAQPKVRC